MYEDDVTGGSGTSVGLFFFKKRTHYVYEMVLNFSLELMILC